MHILSLIIASGLMITSLAMPFNKTNSISTSTEPDIDITARKGIPVTDVECLHLPISSEYSQSAKEMMIEWAENGNKVGSRSNQPVWFPAKASDGVIWIVCNFKYFYLDPIPRKELDQVETILKETCDRNSTDAAKSGRVYSRKWRKEYIVAPHAWYLDKRSRGKHICRHKGVWE